MVILSRVRSSRMGSGSLFRDKPDSRKIGLDQESGHPFWPSALFTLTGTLSYTVTETARQASSAPIIADCARNGFNWRDSSPKNLKSSCSSRHRPVDPGMRFGAAAGI